MFIVGGIFYVLYEPLAGGIGASEWFSKATASRGKVLGRSRQV